jgi:hypothetical protein
MPEDSFPTEMIIPGTYIRVLAEGLISVGGIATGNIGIVGTASKGQGDTHILSDYQGGQAVFGPYEASKPNLTQALEILYQNGAGTVYARALASAAGKDDYTAAFRELLKDDVNILLTPELSTSDALAVLQSTASTGEDSGRDVIAVIGTDATKVDDIKSQVSANKRIILAAPAIYAYDAAAKKDTVMPGGYTASAVAGLLSSLAPQSSPTNKVLPGVVRLGQRFAYGETVNLIKGGVLVLEERLGTRVVRGITTDMAGNGPFQQITTRRITDYAKAGIRQASNPFIGRLNNERVRKALRGAIDGFLTRMVQEEALTGYTLDVTATRPEEIAGRAMVNAVLQPTFSIDFVAVTMTLQ